MIDPARNPQYGSVAEEGKEWEEAVHKKRRAGRGHSPYQGLGVGEGGTKVFFLAGNGKLSEQEGGRQQGGLEPKQGISNLNPSR